MRWLVITSVFGMVAIGGIATIADFYRNSVRVGDPLLSQVTIPGFSNLNLEQLSARNERRRIQNHLALVEELLRTRNVPYLAKGLQEKRRKNLDVLHSYWVRGVFPAPSKDGRFPVFIDEVGVPCALGKLLIESGHSDLANWIAKPDKISYLDKLRDPKFTAWASKSGLFPEELYLLEVD